MKNSFRFAAGAAGFLLGAFGCFAQMGMRGGPPQFHGVWHPLVGHGAGYNMETKDGTKTDMEITIVGKESVDGQDGYWLEMTMNNARMGGDMVMKMLMVADSSNSRTVRMIMQMPGRPPMEMPSQMVQMRHSEQPTDIRTTAEDIGSESVTVPAGTFTCEHYKMKDGSGDVWVTEKVYPWGMVKFQGNNTTMVLTKVMSDAKDKITGTPVPFNPMNMAQPPGQPQ
jgi:hypothetical protein